MLAAEGAANDNIMLTRTDAEGWRISATGMTRSCPPEQHVDVLSHLHKRLMKSAGCSEIFATPIRMSDVVPQITFLLRAHDLWMTGICLSDSNWRRQMLRQIRRLANWCAG